MCNTSCKSIAERATALKTASASWNKILTDDVDVISRFAAVCLFVAPETHSLSYSLLPRCALTINRVFRSFPLFILRLGVQVAMVTIRKRA